MPESENHTKVTAGTDLSGKQLGDYNVLRRLGRGAMAEVYLAEQQSLGRQVALKVLKSDLASDPTCVQRFRREAQAAASLIHSNIVQVHEVACIDGIHFIAQEYVQGVNLQQYLARNGTLDLKLALLVIRQTAAALAKAADQKIVHRDIKPENIMITKSGEVKVADFGLARVLQREGSVQLTQAGMTMGTPLYMSPEQAEGKALDHRSDIYSLGIACYHVLTGHPPFTGETALAVAVQHLNRTPEPLENVRPDLPPALARIIHKMIAKSPNHRYQSARDLIRELRPLLQEYLDEELGDDLPGLDTADLDMISTPLHAATQRLDAVMKSGSESRGRWWRRAVYSAAVLTAFAAGAWIARATVIERPLLKGFEEVPLFKDMGSLPLQVAMAENLDRSQPYNARDAEQAWRSVIKYYGDSGDAYYLGMAHRRIAAFCLERNDFAEALSEYRELYDLAGTADRQMKAEALAGQFYTYERLNRPQDRERVGMELLDLADELEGGPFESTVRPQLEELRARLTKESKRLEAERPRKEPPLSEGSDPVPGVP